VRSPRRAAPRLVIVDDLTRPVASPSASKGIHAVATYRMAVVLLAQTVVTAALNFLHAALALPPRDTRASAMSPSYAALAMWFLDSGIEPTGHDKRAVRKNAAHLEFESPRCDDGSRRQVALIRPELALIRPVRAHGVPRAQLGSNELSDVSSGDAELGSLLRSLVHALVCRVSSLAYEIGFAKKSCVM
jgi:hypothetical protein